MAGWNNGQVMEPGVYVNEPKPKTTKKGSSGVQSGALSINMDDLLEALTGSQRGMISEQPIPKAPKEPKETALRLPGLSGEMGGLAQALVGARKSRQQRYQATDPWSIGQGVIEDPGLAEGLGMKLDKPWKQGLFNIAQNLIGGYVGGKARQGLAEYDRPFMQAIQGAAQSGDFSRLPISSEDDPTGVLQMSLALSGMDDKKAQRDTYNKELIKNGMLMNADGSFSQVPGYAEMRGRIKQAEEGRTGLGAASALASIAPPPSEFDFGISKPSYDEKWNQQVKANMDLGMSAEDAAKQATTRYQEDRKFLASSNLDSKAARDKAATLEGIVAKAEDALTYAPYLGTGSSIWNFVTKPFNTESSKGYAALDMLQGELRRASRIPGSGAESDKELAAALAGGPSVSKSVAENQKVLDILKKQAKVESDFADFMDTAVADTQDVAASRKKWGEYYSQNNPFDDKPDIPWQDAYKRKAPAQTSGIDYGLPPGLPPETIAHVPKIFGGAQQLDMETLLDRTKLVESNNGKSLLSPKGAKGAYQFMDETAYNVLRQMGKDPSTYDSNNEAQQREMARFLYNQLLKQYDGNLPVAVAAYNAGTVKVDEALARARGGQQQAPAQVASNEVRKEPFPGSKRVKNAKTGEIGYVKAS